jgi:hypothetical protein
MGVQIMTDFRTSRRSLLASVPAAALAVTPAMATALGVPTMLAGADTELLALRDEFLSLFERWRNMTVQQTADLEEFEERLQQEAGMSRAEADCLERGSPELKAYHEILHRCVSDSSHYDPQAWEPVEKRFYALAEEILSYRASSREGLALQARAFISSYCEIWEDSDGARAFIECVCAFAGVPFPPYGDIIPESDAAAKIEAQS